MILDALENGFIEGDGPHFPQPRTPIRPAPARSFHDRTYCVAMSPDSVLAAADLGARMVTFSQRPWDDQAVAINTYKERFAANHGRPPHAPVICDFVFCDRDAGRAEDVAQQHIAGYLASVMEHYELESDHFKNAKGYESYGNTVDLMKAIGLEKLCSMYLDVNVWGTPEQIVERLHARREVVGDHDLTCCFRFAGLPYDDAEASMRCFASNETWPERDDHRHHRRGTRRRRRGRRRACPDRSGRAHGRARLGIEARRSLPPRRVRSGARSRRTVLGRPTRRRRGREGIAPSRCPRRYGRNRRRRSAG
jgi:hypothetical protein